MPVDLELPFKAFQISGIRGRLAFNEPFVGAELSLKLNLIYLDLFSPVTPVKLPSHATACAGTMSCLHGVAYDYRRLHSNNYYCTLQRWMSTTVALS